MIEIVTEVPGDVREGAEASDRIADEAMFVGASGRRMDAAIIHVEHERKDHVSIAGKANRAFELLPVRHLEPAVVEAGMENIVGRSQLGEEIEALRAKPRP